MRRTRPDPEKLLQRAKEEDQQAKKGKLKIYLGAAPGVGKTFSMLEDSLEIRAKGIDIVIGVVESHRRKEIEAFLKKFEILPKQIIDYHGQHLEEFDLDGTLKRNPSIVIIDEMAHTNIPGLRHNKRWQDIKEILDRGINVYTTLNVQHIESLNDVVSQIIHTRVKETVPDFMIELADAIELIDIPPEELLKRMQEGKVYIPQQAELAVEHFFRQGNLSALRELALRVTAERVSEQVLSYRQGKGIKFIWPTKEKILVCVSNKPNSAKLIRAARRMATSLQAEWIAVHVDTGSSEEERAEAIKNLRLAEQLGAETRISHGTDPILPILAFARELNITKIVVGKRRRVWWKNFWSRSLTDKLINYSNEIDIYMINDTSAAKIPEKYRPKDRRITAGWKYYSLALIIIVSATILDFMLAGYLQSTNMILVYIIGVTIVALFGQIGPSIFASILSVIAYAYFFISKDTQFFVGNTQNFITLFVMLLVTQIISQLTIRMRRQTVASQLAEERTSTLHSLSRQLAGARGVDKLVDIATNYIASVFHSEVLVLLAPEGHLELKSEQGEAQLSAKDYSVAQWVYDLGQVAGLGTNTLPFSDAMYVPLLASQKPMGVLRVKPKTKNLFTPEQTHLLEACANQLALAIEVDRLHEQHTQSELESKTDRIHAALLESVSHDIRTPIVAAMGSAHTLIELSDQLDRNQIKKLSKEITLELEQLNRLIHNFLQITYLEDKSIRLRKEFCSLESIVNQAIKTSYAKLGRKYIRMHIPSNLPNIPVDSTLIEEVFVNLIDNATKFTAVKLPIRISAKLDYQYVVVTVEDYGPGIMPDEVNKLFEKFYRGRMLTTERGLGLGLSICRAIINAHGGRIWAENRKEGGAAFHFTLPIAL